MANTQTVAKAVQQKESIAIRFVGDSGDGMQLTGGQFTNVSALVGNDISTLPDFPAEIRAPAGSLAGVSGFQLNFSRTDIFTPGDKCDTLVAMNPAALRTNLGDLEEGGIILVNTDSFTPQNLKLAGYESNPLEDGSLNGYQLFQIPISKLNKEAMEGLEIKAREADRCKNFYALGLVCWLYDRPLDPILNWLDAKFGKNPVVKAANTRALKTGYNFGETSEMFAVQYHVAKASLAPGTYRRVRGNEAAAFGMIAAAHLAKKSLFYGSYPITPASEILAELSKHKIFGVKTFQAEDEIAAMAAAIGASFGGAFAATATSGPGLALKGEAIGLAVMTELPVVIVNVQRGGPSTGLPTKMEQADLFQAVMGRNGECPVPVIAAATPSDCFDCAIEAFRLAVKYMTPVILLSDGYLAQGAEPWRIPPVESLPKIEVKHPKTPEGFEPYSRDEYLARPWAIPGTPGLQHRVGGLEKANITGDVSYDPVNHQKMCELRRDKVLGIAKELPKVQINGRESGDLLVVSWGSTYGAVHTAVERAQRKGLSVSHAHLRYIYPFQSDLGDVMKRFKTVLVPENNLGQLSFLLRAEYLLDVKGLNKIQGKPFMIREVLAGIEKILKQDGHK
ncbi:MAG: 2-oxoacid:acceptor oxidoreductase subunit alpha [bacterium]